MGRSSIEEVHQPCVQVHQGCRKEVKKELFNFEFLEKYNKFIAAYFQEAYLSRSGYKGFREVPSIICDLQKVTIKIR